MRKWLLGVMVFALLLACPEQVKASSIITNDQQTASFVMSQNSSTKTAKQSLTKEFLDGVWGNQDGFVCEFCYGEFTGFANKGSSMPATYDIQITKNTIKLSQGGVYVTKLPVKIIDHDCIQVNGVKAYRSGSIKAEAYEDKLNKALLGTWFDCDLSPEYQDMRWKFTNDTIYNTYTSVEDGEKVKDQAPYTIHDFKLTCYDQISNEVPDCCYMRWSKDEIKLYKNDQIKHLLRMKSTKLKEFLNGDDVLTGSYIVEESFQYEELIEISFVDDAKEPMDLNDPAKLALECKYAWNGHELKMTAGDDTCTIYLDGNKRTLAFEQMTLHLIPADSKEVLEFKKNEKISGKNGKVESQSYVYTPEYYKPKDIVKYITFSLKCKNNIPLSAFFYIQPTLGLFYDSGTYGDGYEVMSELYDTDGTIAFAYRPDLLKYHCEDDLAIGFRDNMYQNETILTSTVDKKAHTVTANYQGNGAYQIVDRNLVDQKTYDPLKENPQGSDWALSCETGDMIKLVDMKYLKSSNGHFKVSNASQLATAVYYANTRKEPAVIELMNDIDLSPYKWAAIGWTNKEHRTRYFEGTILGNHHKITRLNLSSYAYSTGFIGRAGNCTVKDLTIEDAKVTGSQYVGILAGQADNSLFRNCSVSGRVTGSKSGSMIGNEQGAVTEDCTADVTVNGKKFNYLSWSESKRSKIVIKNPIKITMNKDHVITRSESTEYHDDFIWMVYRDGYLYDVCIANNKLAYTCDFSDKGNYVIYLRALVSGEYMVVSNQIKFTIE